MLHFTDAFLIQCILLLLACVPPAPLMFSTLLPSPPLPSPSLPLSFPSPHQVVSLLSAAIVLLTLLALGFLLKDLPLASVL